MWGHSELCQLAIVTVPPDNKSLVNMSIGKRAPPNDFWNSDQIEDSFTNVKLFVDNFRVDQRSCQVLSTQTSAGQTQSHEGPSVELYPYATLSKQAVLSSWGCNSPF